MSRRCFFDFHTRFRQGKLGFHFSTGVRVAVGVVGNPAVQPLFAVFGFHKGTDLVPLMELIVEHLPAPEYQLEAPFQMLVADLGYSDYLGRLAIGRVAHGSVSTNDSLVCINEQGEKKKLRATKLQVYEGMTSREQDRVEPGEILVLSGIEEVHIGDTVCTLEQPKPLKRISVDEPTLSMLFSINTSPLAGKEGKWVTTLHASPA